MTAFTNNGQTDVFVDIIDRQLIVRDAHMPMNNGIRIPPGVSLDLDYPFKTVEPKTDLLGKNDPEAD